jgi:hypothetical protein
VSTGDKVLERVIHDITLALQVCPDPRIARLQQQAIAMRSAEMVEELERSKWLVNTFGRPRHG